MFTKLKIPVELLKTSSDRIERLTDSRDYVDIFSRIQNALENLKSSGQWVGDDVDALISVTSSNDKKYKRLINEMKRLGEELDNYANEIVEKDEEIRNKIASV